MSYDKFTIAKTIELLLGKRQAFYDMYLTAQGSYKYTLKDQVAELDIKLEKLHRKLHNKLA